MRLVAGAKDDDKPPDDFVVLSICPTGYETQRGILVFAGNDNGTKYNFTAYSHVVVVTWVKNHESNPVWLPSTINQVLLQMHEHFGSRGYDIVGFSRGVQGFLQMATSTNYLAHAGRVVLAGGAIWQRGNEELQVKRILSGLLRIANEDRSRRPIDLVVMSRMDGTTLFDGSHSLTNKSQVPRIDYKPFLGQIEPFASTVHMMNVASHSEVMAHTLHLINCTPYSEDVCTAYPDVPPDICISDMDRALEAFARMDDGVEAMAEAPDKPLRKTLFCVRDINKSTQKAWSTACVDQEVASSTSWKTRALPLTGEIQKAISSNDQCVLLLTGPTGSGKSTIGPLALSINMMRTNTGKFQHKS